MTTVQKAVNKDHIKDPEVLQAIANTNFAIPVNHIDGVKAYNEKYRQELSAAAGRSVDVPTNMTMRSISRGDILLFADKPKIDPETGNVEIYPMEIYKRLNSYTVELPCEMMGDPEENFDNAVAALPAHMRSALLSKRETVTARFRVVPYIEKYTGQVLTD